MKSLVKNLLDKTGWRLERVPPDERLYRRGGFDVSGDLPAQAGELHQRNPALLDLRQRYRHLQLPMAVHTFWSARLLERDLDLRYFRGDNVYVWQFRNLREQARLKYFMFLRYIASLDTRGLLGQLGEDGLFGCWTFRYLDQPVVSRDLLDSVNELCFLDRQLGIFGCQNLSVLDIGAGYGRLAHRMTQAVSGLSTYACVDAIPESTFLCEFYTRFRGCAGKVRVIPLDQLSALIDQRWDIAVNIHSFSEMSYGAIEGWLKLLASLDVKHLLVVPNDEDRILSREVDDSRKDCAPLLDAAGFTLRVNEPIIKDVSLRNVLDLTDHFLLYAR